MASLAALSSRLDAVLQRLSQLEIDLNVTPADALAARQLAVLDRLARLEAACGLAAAAAAAAPPAPAAAAGAALPLSAGAALLPEVAEVDRSASEVQQRLQKELLQLGLRRHKFVRVRHAGWLLAGTPGPRVQLQASTATLHRPCCRLRPSTMTGRWNSGGHYNHRLPFRQHPPWASAACQAIAWAQWETGRGTLAHHLPDPTRRLLLHRCRRQGIVGAASIHHLCKSIVIENTRAHPSGVPGCRGAPSGGLPAACAVACRSRLAHGCWPTLQLVLLLPWAVALSGGSSCPQPAASCSSTAPEGLPPRALSPRQ